MNKYTTYKYRKKLTIYEKTIHYSLLSVASARTNSTYKFFIAITTVIISGPIIAPCCITHHNTELGVKKSA